MLKRNLAYNEGAGSSQYAHCCPQWPEYERNRDIIYSRESQRTRTFVWHMSEPQARTPTPTPRPPDRWSGRKTLVFIVVVSLLLWAVIVRLIHVL